MKPEDNNIEEILTRYLPSAASPEETQADCDRILQHLRIRASQMPAKSARRWNLTWKLFALVPTAAVILLVIFIRGTREHTRLPGDQVTNPKMAAAPLPQEPVAL